MATTNKVRDGQIEKDYVISWILYGISQNPFLHSNLIFKGGTVLKKAYFKNYRYSEDLDFTLVNDKIENAKIFREFESLSEFVLEEANIPLKRKPETLFENGNVNFLLSYSGPLGGLLGKKNLKIDLARNELITFITPDTPIFREYSDLVKPFSVLCYSKAEVLVEKMRSLMERTQPRDIYDLWYLLEIDKLDIANYLVEFSKKVIHKGCKPNDLCEKLTAKEGKFKSMWKTYLSSQIHDLPNFEGVYRTVMKHLKQLS